MGQRPGEVVSEERARGVGAGLACFAVIRRRRRGG
jgi:hypothetical protein